MKSIDTKLFMLLSLTLALTGCANRKFFIKCQYEPTRRSALSELKPMIVAIHIDDQRPADEKAILATMDVDFMVKGKILTKEPVPDIVAGSLAKEFTINGHHVTQDAGGQADAQVNVRLKRFFGTLILMETTVQIDADVTVRCQQKPSESVPIPITGYFHRKASGLIGKGANPKKEINAALADFVRNFSTEPRVLEALK